MRSKSTSKFRACKKSTPKKFRVSNTHKGFKAGHSNQHYLKENEGGEEAPQSPSGSCLLPTEASVSPDSSPSPPRTRGQIQFEKEKMPKDQEYFIAHKQNLELLFNTSFREHMNHSPECGGNLSLKQGKNTTQRVISSVWSVVCKTCSYESKQQKQYREISRTGKGRCQSSLNNALGFALLNSPIGAAGFRKLMLTLGIDPGSERGIQLCINRANEEAWQLKEKNLAEERKRLKKSGEPVTLEGDSRYNNPIGSASTPMQAASQFTCTMMENMSKEGKIVGISMGSKLCRAGTRQIREGENSACPNHVGCTATMPQMSSIGQEDIQAEEAVRPLKESGIHISEITTDGDSKFTTGVKKHYPNVTCLKDSIHYARAQEKALKSAKFSKGVFKGSTAEVRKQKQNWFARDLKRRCTAEFTSAFHTSKKINKKQHGPTKMNELLKDTPTAILRCIQGDCSLCPKFSFVCTGTTEKNYMKKSDLREAVTLNAEDEKVLLPIILKRLGPQAVKLTYRLTTTQRAEAFNRKLLSVMPKQVTFTRTYRGRTCMALLDHNLGLHRMLNLVLNKAGHSVSEAIYTKIANVYKHLLYRKSYHQKESFKRNRAKKRAGLYSLYRQLKHTPITYKKNSTIFQS